MKQLILGGVRSGKSKMAEQHATQSGLPVTYIATATALDQEMQQRICEHRLRRPPSWHLLEEPIHLAQALQQYASAEHCILVDCLSLWLTNLLLHENKDTLNEQTEALLQQLPLLPGHIIFVSTESGLGIMPTNALARRFCDEAGKLHQTLATLCDQVILSVAGLPHILKRKTV